MSNNLYFKIVTLPEVTEKGVELYFNKYQKTDDLKDYKHAEQHLIENGGKNPLFGSIYSITAGFVSNEEIRTIVLKGSEKDIITEFLNLCNDSFKNHKIAAWN